MKFGAVSRKRHTSRKWIVNYPHPYSRCLFVCLEPHEQFFSYLAAVTIADDRAYLCVALTAFSRGFFYVLHLCDTGPPFLRSYPKLGERPEILTSEYRALGEGGMTTYFKRLRFHAVGMSGARLIDWLFTVLRPAQEYSTYMETSPMPVKGCKI
jgi:hypothetical protein